MRLLAVAAATVALLMSAPLAAHEGEHMTPPWQQASPWPDRIIATFESDPARSLAVSWRTSADVTSTRAEIALALPDARFDMKAQSEPAQTSILSLDAVERAGVKIPIKHNEGMPAVAYHSVRFDGLTPDTLYAYRVMGADGKWSEWFQTRTAPESGPVKFVYMGDAQNGILSHWSRTIRAAFQTAPDARFMLHAGDLVNRGSRDFEWAEWFKAGGFLHAMVPAVPVAGNHEYEAIGLTEADRARALSFLWRPQFRLPTEAALPDVLKETVYALRYTPDLHLFVLDTNQADLTVQAQWLDSQLAASQARWRIVTMHHPVFSSGKGRDNEKLRTLLLPILLKHKVDLVLQGHDHTYARGMVGEDMMAPRRTSFGQGEKLATMFVNSVSGPKQYEFKADGWKTYEPAAVNLERQGENTQFYQVISIDGETLDYTAYTSDGLQYDRVVIEKKQDGIKRVTTNENTAPPTRTRENTVPYVSPNF
ncbi:MAG: metallophosphoesterase [Polymorphobacter sp.]|uniref:metallophosphoesterase n=1 Tax=Polymorphobacter sp. TaxID=1909290 RepID=UPI003A847726